MRQPRRYVKRTDAGFAGLSEQLARGGIKLPQVVTLQCGDFTRHFTSRRKALAWAARFGDTFSEWFQ